MIHSYFVEGKKSYQTNPGDECPYPVDSEARRSWIAGWDHEWFASCEPGAFE